MAMNPSDFEDEDEARKVIGKKVEVKVKDGIFRGEIVSYNPLNRGHLVLRNVTKLDVDEDGNTSAQQIQNFIPFFDEDFPQITFLEDERIMGNPNFELMQKVIKPSHLKETRIPSDKEIVKKLPGVNIPQLLPHEIVDSVCESNFKESVTILSQMRVIGMGVAGVNVSRNGKLSWITFCIDEKVFLFDISKLKEEGFSLGLADILESRHICKVIHDCRFISDCLCHQYAVNLINVWDTQVASSEVFRRNHQGCLPRFVEPLNKCLYENLPLPHNTLPTFFSRLLQCVATEDLGIWEERPLRKELTEYLVGQVMYLKDLKKALLEKMLGDFLTGVDVCLSCVKDAPDNHVEKLIRGSHLMPTKFLWMADRELERKAEEDCEKDRDPITGYKEVVSGIKGTNIRFSKDLLHSKVKS